MTALPVQLDSQSGLATCHYEILASSGCRPRVGVPSGPLPTFGVTFAVSYGSPPNEPSIFKDVLDHPSGCAILLTVHGEASRQVVNLSMD